MAWHVAADVVADRVLNKAVGRGLLQAVNAHEGRYAARGGLEQRGAETDVSERVADGLFEALVRNRAGEVNRVLQPKAAHLLFEPRTLLALAVGVVRESVTAVAELSDWADHLNMMCVVGSQAGDGHHLAGHHVPGGGRAQVLGVDRDRDYRRRTEVTAEALACDL